MKTTSHRRNRGAAAATAPVAPAIDASVERAAIERDPAGEIDPVAGTAPIVPAAAIAADDTKVLPEPTLTAQAGEPMPIVTASPILAAEPSSVDVVKAEAAADRVAAGIEPAGDPDGPHAAAAGQPTLTIEGDATRRVGIVDGVGDAARDILGDHHAEGDMTGLIRELTEFRDRDPAGFTRLRRSLGGAPGAMGGDELATLTLDEIVHGLEHLSLSDPIGMDIVRTRFFGDPLGEGAEYIRQPAAGSTVTVIEVVGPPQGRRRAGRSFGAQPQRFLEGELTDDEIASLRSDPQLAVGVSEVPADVFGEPLDV